MKTVGAFEAKARLSELLAEVAGGQEVLITKRGVPVAVLRPANTQSQLSVKDAISRIRQRRGLRLRGMNVRALIDMGRRR